MVSLPSQLCFCTSLPLSRVTTVCRATGQRQEVTSDTHTRTHACRARPVVRSRPSRRTDPRLPVVGGRLVERLVEFKLDFGGLEGALGLHANYPLIVHAHYQVGFGPVSHLPGRKPHTCREGGKSSDLYLKSLNHHFSQICFFKASPDYFCIRFLYKLSADKLNTHLSGSPPHPPLPIAFI